MLRSIALLCALSAIVRPAPSRADLVLSTLPSDPSRLQTGAPGRAYGQAFQAGTADLSNLGARLQLDPGSSPADLSRLRLVLDAANADGTIGPTFFDGFTASGSRATGVVDFTPHGGYTLLAGAAYWLVLTDRDGGPVAWDFSNSGDYVSASGYGIPASASSFFDDGTHAPTYADLADGPQVFALEKPFGAIAVPVPSTLSLAAIGLLSLALARRPRAGGPREPAPPRR